MPIVYRQAKGAPLTSHEIDGNFEELVNRIEALEKNPVFAEGIQKIDQKGDILEIFGNYGTCFGQFKLPTLAYVFRETWKPQTPYAMNDVVHYKGMIWVCIKSHQSPALFDSDQWRIFLNLDDILRFSRTLNQLAHLTDEDLSDPSPGRLGFYSTPDQQSILYSDGEQWHQLSHQPLYERETDPDVDDANPISEEEKEKDAPSDTSTKGDPYESDE